jgi:hypothetical protein
MIPEDVDDKSIKNDKNELYEIVELNQLKEKGMSRQEEETDDIIRISCKLRNEEENEDTQELANKEEMSGNGG